MRFATSAPRFGGSPRTSKTAGWTGADIPTRRRDQDPRALPPTTCCSGRETHGVRGTPARWPERRGRRSSGTPAQLDGVPRPTCTSPTGCSAATPGRGGRRRVAGATGAPHGDAARRPAADRRARVPRPRGGVRTVRAGQPRLGHQLLARARARRPVVRRGGPRDRDPAAGARRRRRGGGRGRVASAPVLGVFGFVYPGKGHRQVVRAAAALRRAGTPVRVRVLGDAAPGHADEIDAAVRTSRDRGVPVEVTGRVARGRLVRALRRVGVPVAAHRNVSASGSVNSWIAAGRRPLVRDSAYAREMAALRPGTLTLFDDATLVPRLEDALRRPGLDVDRPGTDLGPRLEDTAAAYRTGGRRWADDRAAVRHQRARQPLGPRPGRCAAAHGLGRRGPLRAAGRARPHPGGAGAPDPPARRGRGRRRRVPRAPVVPHGVRLVRQDDDGFRAAAVRNLGVAASTGDVLVLLDADTTPEPALRRAHGGAARGAARGPGRRPTAARRPRRRRRRRTSCPSRRGCARRTPRPATCWTPTRPGTGSSSAPSLACSRWWYDEIGGFDETLPRLRRRGLGARPPVLDRGRAAGAPPGRRRLARRPGRRGAGARPGRAPARDRRRVADRTSAAGTTWRGLAARTGRRWS